MDEPRAQRTLVKSPPELWAEVSDLEALARHLGEFGEVRITRLEPETAVAWEGDRARGTVKLEPSGWGTKVTLTAQLEPGGGEAPDGTAEAAPQAGASPPEARTDATAEVPAAPEPADESGAADAPGPEPAAQPRRRFFARLFARWRATRAGEPEGDVAAGDEDRPAAAPQAEAEPVPEPVAKAPAALDAPPQTPTAIDAARAEAILTEVLDDLGAAHHRPFSRLG